MADAPRPAFNGVPLMSLSEAAAWGITHLRDPKWANPMDHVAITIIEGRPAPWAKLFCPDNVGLNGKDPVPLLALRRGADGSLDIDAPGLVPYHGPRHDDAAYQAEVASRSAMWASFEKEHG